MLGPQGSHCHDKTDSGVVDTSEGVGRKHECQVGLAGIKWE